MFNSKIFILFGILIIVICENLYAGNNGFNDKYKNKTELIYRQNNKNQVQLKEGNDKKYEFFLVKFDRLAVMDSPSSLANVIGSLAKGDTVKAIGFTTTTDKFDLVAKLIKFQFNDQVGYVNSLYLKKIYQFSTAGEKPDAISIYAGIIFLSGVMLLGLFAN